MFTGIVSDVGTVQAVAAAPAGRRTRIATNFDVETIAIGTSIACGGPCHTVVETGRDDDGQAWFDVVSAAETLRLTTAGDWNVGTRLNLERALRIGDELGGHIVLGHIDGLAKIVERQSYPQSVYMRFHAPGALAPFIARKGSVALDGTSLTINAVEGDTFSVFLVPHTLQETTWETRRVGDKVNLEVDMMARYAARLAEFAATT